MMCVYNSYYVRKVYMMDIVHQHHGFKEMHFFSEALDGAQVLPLHYSIGKGMCWGGCGAVD